MPFDASKALKNQRAADLAAAQGPDEHTSAAPLSRSSEPRRFQRPAPESTPPPEAAPARRFQSPSATAAPSPAPAGRFQRPGPTVRPAAPSGQSPETVTPVARPPAPRPQNGNQMPSQGRASFDAPAPAPKGYANRVGPIKKSSRIGLSPRLELYIDELAFSRGWSRDEVERRKNEAVQKPKEAETTYQQMFAQVRQQREQTIPTLNKGIQDNPGKIVFVTRRHDNEPGRFSALSPEDAGDLHILHASAFHSMPASATLFDDPAKVFAPKAASVLEDTSDLDSDDLPEMEGETTAPASRTRSPRP